MVAAPSYERHGKGISGYNACLLYNETLRMKVTAIQLVYKWLDARSNFLDSGHSISFLFPISEFVSDGTRWNGRITDKF